MMLNRLFAVLIILALVSGCAVGVKHDYVRDDLTLWASKEKSYVVATLDHRGYVLNRRVNENYVGKSRGGFGNPFDVVTLSGNPLASDISTSIATSLQKYGADASVVTLEPAQSVTDAMKILLPEGADRTLLIVLREWISDAMMNVRIIYDFDLYVYDESGNQLVRKKLTGDENLGASDPFKPGGTKKVGARFKSLFEYLFDDEEVRRHLE
jgi:hypothetical protein